MLMIKIPSKLTLFFSKKKIKICVSEIPFFSPSGNVFMGYVYYLHACIEKLYIHQYNWKENFNYGKINSLHFFKSATSEIKLHVNIIFSVYY